MSVAICIVGFRNHGDIEQCLVALARSEYTDFIVLICENGGAESYEELCRRVPRRLPRGQQVMLILAPRNLGYAGGVNICIGKSSDADAWWVLNPDTQPEPGALSEMVKELKRGRAQMIGGTVLDEAGRVGSYGGKWRPWLARAESIGIGSDPAISVDQAVLERELSFISGCSLLVSREFVERAGLMREDYFLYGEEVEWALRGLSCGLRLGVAYPALILHKGGTSTGSGGDMCRRPKLPIYLDERNKILVTRDCFPARLPVAAFGALILIFLRYGRRGAWRQLCYAMQGWAAGLRNRRGPPGWLAGL